MDSNEIVREFRYTVPTDATPQEAEELRMAAARHEAEKVRNELIEEARKRLFSSQD